MTTHFQELVINQNQSVVDGIASIECSAAQIALITDDAGVLVGILTNGDVRRYLMRGGQTSVQVKQCMNRDFKAVRQGFSREELLKLFDIGYSAVPIVDDERRLIDFATPGYFPPAKEAAVLARARAPVRVSFSGGGTDLTYYFMLNKGAVLNTSLALYAHATLIPSDNPEINIYSQDIDRHERYANLRELLDSTEKGLFSSVVSVIRPAFGFDLFVHSDFPVGSGLGGSSAVATSVVAAFNELRLDKWSTYEIAELAFHAERLCFNVAGGWQDQYASAFGGFNLIEFDGVKNMVHPIRLEPDISCELEECLLLCDTTIEHHSGEIHERQRQDFNNPGQAQILKDIVEMCMRMHRHLLRGELTEFGTCLHEGWQMKQSLSSAIGGRALDTIYNAARDSGALGGKLLGAGGGGFFLFYVQPRMRTAVTNRLKELGCKLRPVRFESEGVRSWRTKVA